MDKRLAECQRVIGYHFANPKLLEIALTHSSLRTPDRECNERLEFLGDSVLGLVVTEELYRLLPDQAEGELTRIKSAVVSRGALYRASTALGLARFAEFARGVSRRHELPVSVIANLVESVIGAIYLDAGYYPSREFVLRHLAKELDDTLHDRGAKNYKSLLQHEVQQSVSATPSYRTVDEEGPHHRKQFTVAAVIRGQEWSRGSGATKKEAEQEAARKALQAWQRRGRGRRRRGRKAPPADGQAKSTAVPEPVRGRRRAAARKHQADRDEEPRREERPTRGRRRPSRRPAAKRKPAEETAPAKAADGAFGAGIEDAPARPRKRTRKAPATPDAEKPPARRRTRRRADPVEEAPAPEPKRERAPRTSRRKPKAEPKPEPKTEPEPTPVDDGFAVGLDDAVPEPRKRVRRTRRTDEPEKPATRRRRAKPKVEVAPEAEPEDAPRPKRTPKPEPDKARAPEPEPAPKRRPERKPVKAEPKPASEPEPEPAPKRKPAKAAAAAGFADGLDVPAPKKARKPAAKKKAPKKPAKKAEGRRKAPKIDPPPPPDDGGGFDAGL